MPTESSALSSVWHGQLELNYQRQGDKTQCVRSLASSPLKIQRSLYPEGPSICHNIIIHTAGGMVGGDRLSQQIELQPDTQVCLTTPAASKIYRSNGLTTYQQINLNIGPNARLEWLPQETIAFNGAQFRQDLRVDLAPGAQWLGWDITRFGRSARGEKFLEGEWRSHTEVWQQGQPLWIDRQWLPGDNENIWQHYHGLAGQPVVGTFIWLGLATPSQLQEQAREIWRSQPRQGESGVTSTLGEGLLCRYRGPSTAEARDWFTQVWRLIRCDYLHLPWRQPRVWV